MGRPFPGDQSIERTVVPVQLADIDVLNPERYWGQMPHDQYAFLRAEAPCFEQRINEPALIERAWVVTRYSDVRRFNRDDVNFLNYGGVTLQRFTPTTKGNGKPAMISLDGAEHRRNRSLVNQGFTRRAIDLFEGSFRELASRIVDKAVDKGTFDFVDDVAVELPMQVICQLMGVPSEDQQKVLRWSNVIASPVDPELAPTPEAQLEAAQGLWQYGLELATLRRRHPGADIMSKLGQAVDGDQLTDDELMGFTLLLVGAGNETTRNALSHGLHALMANPDQLTWLRQHADRVPDSAVEEILRVSTPVVLMRRTAAHDMVVHGCDIAAGDSVALMYGSANFDPDQFPDPHALDLQRTPNDHLTFGYGRHLCIGAFVARLEIRLLLEEFLRRTIDVRPAGEPQYGRDCYFRPVKHLPVTVEKA